LADYVLSGFQALNFIGSYVGNALEKKWVYLFNEVDQVEKHTGGEWEGEQALLEARVPVWRKWHALVYRFRRGLS
jgi:hypothetical protein